MEKLRKFKVVAETSDLTDKMIDKALTSGFSDFEDALQYFCALQSNCNILLTRNEKDFKIAKIPVLSPFEYLKGRKRR
jgi:predicted nucleic acid-binding protein